MIHVNRWWILVILSVFGVTVLRTVYAENVAVVRIGEVWLGTEAAAAPVHQGFVEGLRDLGYIEGQNLILLTRYANLDESRLPLLLEELISVPVDVFFVSAGAIRPAMKATTTIPIVCATMNDPVGAGLVASLSRPGGNLTGVSWQTVDTATKRLELALELTPKLSRLAVLFETGNREAQLEAEAVSSAARKAKVLVVTFGVHNISDVQAAFVSMGKRRPQALYVVDTAFTVGVRAQIAPLALRIRVPMISEGRLFAEAGGVLTYGAKLQPAIKRGAEYVDKILRGAKPEDLPIEQATEFELVVNLKSAKAVGVKIPELILSRADLVIR